MKLLILVSFLMISNSAMASYHRFWIGYKKESLSTEKFLNGLNLLFFRETIKVGGGKGLIAYQPYVTQMKGDTPDEIALVTYESEEKYKAIRSTPEGKQYGERHWEYFEKEKSKSTVPTLFTGVFSNESAFELSPGDWQDGVTYVIIYENKKANLVTLAKEFGSLKNNKSVNNSIILINEKFIYEYRSMKKKGEVTALTLPVIEMKMLPSHEINNFPAVGFGEGINFRISE